MRRIGVLMSVADSDPEGQASVIAFVQRLKELGWTAGVALVGLLCGMLGLSITLWVW